MLQSLTDTAIRHQSERHLMALVNTNLEHNLTQSLLLNQALSTQLNQLRLLSLQLVTTVVSLGTEVDVLRTITSTHRETVFGIQKEATDQLALHIEQWSDAHTSAVVAIDRMAADKQDLVVLTNDLREELRFVTTDNNRLVAAVKYQQHLNADLQIQIDAFKEGESAYVELVEKLQLNLTIIAGERDAMSRKLKALETQLQRLVKSSSDTEMIHPVDCC
jgi:hypothetical protein